MTVKREDQTRVGTLSLEERVAIESQAWDNWALQQDAHSFVPIAGLYPGMRISREVQATFPHPPELWVGTDASRLWQFEHLAPAQDKVILQIGGRGTFLLRFILAGARYGVCADPSIESLRLGERIAALYGVSSKIQFLRGVAERLPFPGEFFDAIYGSSTLHHTLLEESAQELRRVLKRGGRASFHDPLEGSVLTRFARKYLPFPGKGEEGVDYPLTYPAAEAFIEVFGKGEYQESELFGVPLKILVRIHKKFRSVERALRRLDDHLVKNVPPLRRFCKGISIRVERTR